MCIDIRQWKSWEVLPDIKKRGVAQPGSAPEWGSGGRRFKSSHPEFLKKNILFCQLKYSGLFYFLANSFGFSSTLGTMWYGRAR
jgi:hypothetical protein